MALTDIESVRLKTSDKSTLVREVRTGNGVQTIYQLDHRPLLAGTLAVYINDVAQTLTTDYTVDEDNGWVTFVTAPAANDEVVFLYYWSLFTDEEIEAFLSESGDNITLASARLLLALSADAAKLAERETLQGGGGMGMVTRDTSVTAKELRETAKALVQFELEVSKLEGIEPADGFTEVAWTEFQLNELSNQDWVRELLA